MFNNFNPGLQRFIFPFFKCVFEIFSDSVQFRFFKFLLMSNLIRSFKFTAVLNVFIIQCPSSFQFGNASFSLSLFYSHPNSIRLINRTSTSSEDLFNKQFFASIAIMSISRFFFYTSTSIRMRSFRSFPSKRSRLYLSTYVFNSISNSYPSSVITLDNLLINTTPAFSKYDF